MRSTSILAAPLFSAAVIFVTATGVAEANTGKQCGGASWYALHSKTASGEMMNPNAMTAAHRSLPFGTKVRVTHKRSGRSTVVRVNDRGPFIKGRIVDLSKAAAGRLGLIQAGHGEVCLEVMP
ncbi:MAG: septal ring lytic transglycosylase RlpA family protein [Nitratireductor sp.]|nr:septal ring lytic transglycosylase RlpA family protein [Nitratireductor sp.]